jgi:hypothetical protein
MLVKVRLGTFRYLKVGSEVCYNRPVTRWWLREQGVQMSMASTNAEAVVGRLCRLLRPVRDHEGRTRYSEKPKVLREVNNLDRQMLLVQFDDGATTFLFPDEVVVEN